MSQLEPKLASTSDIPFPVPAPEGEPWVSASRRSRCAPVEDKTNLLHQCASHVFLFPDNFLSKEDVRSISDNDFHHCNTVASKRTLESESP